MKTPVLQALTASIWAAGLLTAPLLGAQTAVTRGVTTSTVAAAPVSASVAGDVGTDMANVGPSMDLTIGKSTLLRMPSAVTRISLGNPNVADVTLISPTELYLLGKAYGSTNLIVWRKGGGPTAIDVNVNIDHKRMEAKLRELLPDEKGIQVRPAADSVILTGVVSSAVKAKAAEEIAAAFVRDVNKSLVLPVVAGDNRARSGTELAVSSGSGGGASAANAAGAKVVNLLSIAEAQQVMLEVTVAEVSKTLMDKMGANLLFSRTNGSWTYGIASALGGDGRGLLSAIKSNGNGLEIDAEKSDGLVKILAEPNLVAISGQEASFLAGGKIFIPVARSTENGGTTITLEEKEFGVGVKFTPTVLEGGRIHLKVAPEVSELSQTGSPFTTVSGQTAILPSFTTRRAQTSVQLMDGQSLAIAGLIKNNVRQAIDAVPGLGEVPILGNLFRSNEFQGDRSELMFVITPRLIKPLDPGYLLPTDGYKPPSRQELYLGNKLEGSGRADVPADRPAAVQPAPAARSGGMEVK
ncbi:MAG: type II and III secretion system protein family protein [Hydrogenophaga sp.]|uniref:type II and III secretion system protein family protein n=1 Tax=Hydrogenophaga sp. TaxID=1904254 RepID=UPI00272195B7|nr:type II and III secretion system protein family protein [Hydrogenophaga sp.]MDO9146661.1 type II and III secretion system protein family protein [Hydrogenophaga sp.]MDO9605568.1 type II and III secretion system protein family protein [Hydrogenophaga sp.]MDP2162779.1 type II and III secretion system protein family protein [Hydrogenophaga sp.]MDP3476950.1 type II and III secretion system protein family protein [Hydrogenophaga sp.]